MVQTEIILTIAGMALVTAGTRVIPAVAFAEKALPPGLRTWLKYIPVSLIAALLFPEVFLRNDTIDISFRNSFFWISIPTAFVALKTRNIAWTVVFGCAVTAAFRLL